MLSQSYFPQVTWEQANPTLTGAAAGQDLIRNGLQNYFMGAQAPYAQSNALADAYTKGETAKFLNYNLLANSINNPASYILAATHPELIKPVFGAMANALPTNATAYGGSVPGVGNFGTIGTIGTSPNTSSTTNDPSGGSFNVMNMITNLARQLNHSFGTSSSSIDQSTNNSSSSASPTKVSNSDNAGLATYDAVGNPIKTINGITWVKINNQWQVKSVGDQ